MSAFFLKLIKIYSQVLTIVMGFAKIFGHDKYTSQVLHWSLVLPQGFAVINQQGTLPSV